MESITKNRQSTQVLRAMIERAFGPEQVPEGDDFAHELGHGWFNVAYRIDLRDATPVVLKIAPPAGVRVMTYEHDMMANEVAALALVTEHTDVAVPTLLYSDTAHDLVDADWFFMSFVEGDNVGILAEEGKLTAAELDHYNELLGAANRELNTIVGPHFGPLPGPGETTWRATFSRMIEAVLTDGEQAQVDVGQHYAEIRRIIADHAELLDDVTEPRFVEWDLWTSNMMVHGGALAAIIDHERAIYGDPLFEAGFTAIDLPDVGDPTGFMRGYGHAPLTERDAARRRLYTLYLVLIMVIETVYRGHTDTKQYDWARAQLAGLLPRLTYAG